MRYFLNTSKPGAGDIPTLSSAVVDMNTGAQGDAAKGGISVLLSPTVGYSINEHHAVSLGANIKINKAGDGAETLVGFNVPVSYKFTF